MATHYAPQTPLRLIENASRFSPPAGQRVGLLAWRGAQTEDHYTAVRRLSDRQHLGEAAANLFRYLRELDALKLDLIVAEHVPEQGLGAAIMDRLRRASGGR
jgi:L-threonylcarbamoyladenylate synthase